MNRLIEFIKKVLYKYDIEISELQSAVGLFLMGIALTISKVNPTIFGWGSFYKFILGLSVLFISGVHFSGLIKRNQKIRQNSAFISTIVWTYFATFIHVGGGVLTVLCSTFALSSALFYLRLVGILSTKDVSEDGNGSGTVHSPNTERTPSIHPGETNFRN